MHLSVIVAVFPIIFIGELPDKTMFATLVLATRARGTAIWLGAAAAFLVHVVIAVTIGAALVDLVSHRVLEGIVGVIFLGGALLASREVAREQRDVALAEREAASGRHVVTTTFVVIFLAEWGDLTQILTANLAAHYRSALSVGVGALLALWVVSALAVLGGKGVLRFVDVRVVRVVTTAVLVGLAGWAFAQALS